LDHIAVKAYRDKFKFCPNRGLRADIIATVKDQILWLKILNSWKYQTESGRVRSKNPLAVKAMLNEYEIQVEKVNAIQQKVSRVYCEKSLPVRSVGRVPKQGMPALLKGARSWK